MSLLLLGAGACGSAAGPTPFVSDTFTDADSTVIASHTGETGATWTNIDEATGYITTNAARIEAGSFKASGTPGSADYYAEIGIVPYGSLSGVYSAGVIGRWAGAGDGSGSYYTARFVHVPGDESVVNLVAVGPDYAESTIGTYAYGAGTPTLLRLTFAGTSIKVHTDGVERISVTDASFASAGRVGIEGSGNTTGPDDGLFITSITAQ